MCVAPGILMRSGLWVMAAKTHQEAVVVPVLRPAGVGGHAHHLSGRVRQGAEGQAGQSHRHQNSQFGLTVMVKRRGLDREGGRRRFRATGIEADSYSLIKVHAWWW